MTRALRFFITGILAAATPALAKSPTDTSTVCDRYQKSDIIFTGSAETMWITMVDTRKSPIHRRSEKSKRVRFLVREWFKGRRADTVEVWLTPGDCDLKIEANQTYLIYARIDKDSKDKKRIVTNGCMGTVLVANAAGDLAYLTAAQLGAGSATRISGMASGPGLNIEAKSGVDARYALTDGAGKFTFDGLPAGDWNLATVGSTDASPAHLEPSSCLDVTLK